MPEACKIIILDSYDNSIIDLTVLPLEEDMAIAFAEIWLEEWPQDIVMLVKVSELDNG